MAVLHPLECYLLERFSSPDHFAATRDAIIEWIDAHETAYARLQSKLDPHQRSKPQWQQGDVVWGGRVLPIIRSDRDRYTKAYIQRINNDLQAFKAGHSMRSNNLGISEFWDGWMTEEERQLVFKTKTAATKLDHQLGATNSGSWREGLLTYNGQGSIYQVTDLPRRIPRYLLDPNVRIEKNESAKRIGIYLPDIEFSAARLLYPTELDGSAEAYQGVRRSDYVNETTGKHAYDWKESRWAETGWTLIRRVEGEFIDVPEKGFFPKGEPEELYTWPEREARFISREDVIISDWSGALVTHTGKWAISTRKGFEYQDLQQGQHFPFKDEQSVKWTLISRADGGSCIEPPR